MRHLFLLATTAVSLAAGALSAPSPSHPLDPLTFQEYWTVLETLHAAERLDQETRFSIVTLKEPGKELVWSWSEGAPMPRRAFALVRRGEEAYEAVVDLVKGRVESWEELRDAHPNFLAEEFEAAAEAIEKHPDFLAAMRRRGITDLTFIECSGGPPGYYATPEQRGRRVAHVHCMDVRGARNLWTRQIAGLTVVVDLLEKKVLRVVDEGAVPLPDVSADYDPASIGEPREVPGPIAVSQPSGPGFTLEGNVLEWQNWRFHVRPDQRLGVVVSTVTYDDRGEPRRVLYQGSLSEIFVPYMDPSFSWYHRNFIDAGEFSFGGLIKPLMAGLDCPAHAVYVDGMVAGDEGRPRTVPRQICIFEREAGDMAWRHHGNEPESRVQRDLVVRSAAVLGNYDYVFDWTFRQDGSLEVGIGATGIAEAKLVVQESAGVVDPDSRSIGADGMPAEPADAYGRFVDRHVVAVNHDHYFSFRLDLDVDGARNSLVVDRLVTRRLPEDHPRRSLWMREAQVARTESEGMLDIDLSRPALWRVVSGERTNHVGYPTSYQLRPGRNAKTLLSPDDYPRRRAGFIDHHLWTTPYRPEERYAAGDHPTLSTPGQGLPAWTEKDRDVEDTDIVLWHTVAMHHMVRAEDWPVMPVMWHSFELRPFDFFDRNPALDLPRR